MLFVRNNSEERLDRAYPLPLCCRHLRTSYYQGELVGRLDLSVAQLMTFAEEGTLDGDGKTRARSQKLPLKNRDGASVYADHAIYFKVLS